MVTLFKRVAASILKLFGADDENVSEDEIVSMLNEGHEQGVFETSEAKMITNIFELNNKVARDIMTHRKSICFINGEDSLESVVDFLLLIGKNTRYPVYKENIDNIIGILNLKDALICHRKTKFAKRNICNIPNLIRPATFIPENRSLDSLFNEMQATKKHMVIIVDEYGQTAGIVTMEDILEVIVGNIMDEYDEDEKNIEKMADGSFVVNGLTSLEDLEEELSIKFDEDDMENFDTINGLMISMLDRILADGEEASVNIGGYVFKTIDVSNKFINWIKVERENEYGKDEHVDPV